MENMPTHLEQYAQAHLGPTKVRPQPRPYRSGNPAPTGTLKAAQLLMMTSVFSTHVENTTPWQGTSNSGTLIQES